jgi:hypothetical protein
MTVHYNKHDIVHHLMSLQKNVSRTGTCLSPGTRLLQLFLRDLNRIPVFPSLYLMTEGSIFQKVEVEKTKDDR